MEDQQKPPAKQTSQPETPIHDFEALTADLNKALQKFQDEQSPENFAVIVTALSEFGISGADLWHQVSAYAKRNPMRVAMFVGLVFFALKGIGSQAAARRLSPPTVH